MSKFLPLPKQTESKQKIFVQISCQGCKFQVVCRTLRQRDRAAAATRSLPPRRQQPARVPRDFTDFI
ncbi:hypothetical protein [Neisseria shayeganii]|uniref:Uncharacterized protein n=1 Tax=Neisseria shayeganii TaxID=607712 RepID=A0A7D7S6N8_9NEIS|nr:hypothetical protein [Neisseria shayeganii]QMT39868.1 hypothetical protein H3L94_08335 [Neisseria shayeganii]